MLCSSSQGISALVAIRILTISGGLLILAFQSYREDVLVAEFVYTAVLCYVVLAVATTKNASKDMFGLAIGIDFIRDLRLIEGCRATLGSKTFWRVGLRCFT